MKITTALLTFILLSNISWGQKPVSGEYEFGLKLALDSSANKLTGYFENYTGWDEETNLPKFSCIFYFEGTIWDKKVKISTYDPTYKSGEIIEGTLEIIDNKTVNIKLTSEHGGCWNVQHFVEEPAKFELERPVPWIQIRYVKKNKSYFYSEKSINKKRKAYLVKNDFVCIDKLDGDWAYCTFYGTKATKGWIKITDLNKIL